ncbi:fimbrial biogenesis chaperone [Pseudomonas kulmbachensis]|uniref:fimbrial biogenesis chaperone n=1 Tax=Pseudomonas kulmbachensis TaxID=3043408 RepID=UPI002AAF7C03|nr:molecular chaperone [Pseudomonas sp. V3/3/4/13]
MLLPSLNMVAALFTVFLYSQAEASITLSSTRVIFEGNKKEASVTVRNLSSDEILVQSWLDNDNPGKTSASIPFAVTPPLAHMAAQSRQILRVLFKGTGVPTDKESVFWLNVQEIPKAAEGENILQLAVRQRIKFFYRPSGLSGTAKTATEAVTLAIESRGLIIKNPTAYHVTLTDIQVKGSTYTSAPIRNFMLAPGETKHLNVPGISSTSSLTLTAGSIDDFGAKNVYSTSLGSTPSHLKPLKP